MTTQSSAAHALASIPGWASRRAAIEPLPGGTSKRAFLVTSGSRRYVLRLAGTSAASGARSVARECRVQAAAADAGLAPAIVYADPVAGILLSDYLPGRSWRHSDLLDADKLTALAQLLRRVHRLPPCGTPFPAVAAAETYRDALAGTGAAQDTAALCLDIVRNAPQAALVCSHNDLIAENVVDGDTLCLVDWEYAADNDPLFDLASLAGWHDLDAERVALLLDAYVDGAPGDWHARFRQQLRRFDAIQWLWLAARSKAASRPPARLEQIRERLARQS